MLLLTAWKMPIIIKRLDARYDWLMGRWSAKTYQLADAGDGCKPSPSLGGAVQSMAKSNASGVLVYSLPGNPIQDMNCVDLQCFLPLGIPAAMVHQEVSVAQALRFEFSAGLQIKLQSPAKVIPVFDHVTMQGDKGAVATVDLPSDLWDFDTLELDASLSCPGRRDSSCAQWDHTVQLFVCCDQLSPYCNTELGRWITAFRSDFLALCFSELRYLLQSQLEKY
ncbi:hypothetical protein XENOCAPTIV_025300 [Xenoophorus captivus]|uniref:Peptide-N-glycosidase F N-terminal domain-containing protein n=1 Tax=Xenoophorus captivus TaxID=1517983 RepID=A0ABV0QP65_9TELE